MSSNLNQSEEIIQINSYPYPTPGMFNVKEDHMKPQPEQKYTSPYYDQSSYCQRSGVKPFQVEKEDISKINLTNRATTEDDITQDLAFRKAANAPEVEPYRARFLRQNGHSSYVPSRAEVRLSDDLKHNNDLKRKEGYPTYGFSDQHDIYSSSGYVNETLNEELREPFTMFDKEYNIFDIIGVIIFIFLFVVLIFIIHDYIYLKNPDEGWINKYIFKKKN